MLTRRSFLVATSAGLAGSELPALADIQPQGFKPARTQILTFQPQFVTTFKSTAPGLTFSSLYNLESSPDWIRLVYRNDLRDDVTIDGAVIAPTALMADGFTPYAAKDQADGSLWKRVTFSDGDVSTSPGASRGGGDETVRIAGDATWGRDPGPCTFSDWIPIQPLKRADGGIGTLLLVRTFSRGLFRNQFARYQKIGGDSIGRLYAGFASSGDGTKAPWSFAGESSEIPAACAVQYRASVPGASVLFAGDSILAPPYAFSIGLRTCAMASTPQVPISFINQARLGAKTIEYVSAARGELEWSQPQILVLQPWSSNDTDISEAAVDAAHDLSMKLVSFALRKKCAPIFLTQTPLPTFPALEPLRQRNNAWVRDAASKGLAVLDLDKLWSNETTPGTFRPGYSRDQIHGTDIACNAAAEALTPIIRGLLA